jgi:hypothetical protein
MVAQSAAKRDQPASGVERPGPDDSKRKKAKHTIKQAKSCLITDQPLCIESIIFTYSSAKPAACCGLFLFHPEEYLDGT